MRWVGVCYRALTGQVPDDATDRMREDPLIPVSQRCAGRASGAFLSAIDAALSVDEGDRPQSVGAWREVLEKRQEQGTSESQRRERKEILDKVRQIEEQVALEADAREEEVRREQAAQRSSLPEQASLAEDRDKFVAEMGREPSHWGRTHGATDLHIAARLNLPVLTRSLLTQGADVHAKDNDGWTPLHRAAWEDATATAEVLLKGGAYVHAKDKSGWTPLERAVYRNAHKTTEVLRRYGGQNNKSSGEGDEGHGHIVAGILGGGVFLLIFLLSHC